MPRRRSPSWTRARSTRDGPTPDRSGGAGDRRSLPTLGVRLEEPEAAVVAGPDDVAEHGRVVQASGHPGALQGPGDEPDGLPGHQKRASPRVVQAAHLARRPEPAPPGLQRFDDLPG